MRLIPLVSTKRVNGGDGRRLLLRHGRLTEGHHSLSTQVTSSLGPSRLHGPVPDPDPITPFEGVITSTPSSSPLGLTPL